MHQRGAKIGQDLQQVVEPQFGDAVNLAQALGHFVAALVLEAAGEGVDDAVAGQAIAIRAFDGEDEWETELELVVGVKPMQGRVLLRAAQVKPRFGLLQR